MNELERIGGGLITKAEKENLINSVKEEILSGNVNPLKVELYLKNLSDIIEKIRKDSKVREYIMDEADKNGNSFDFMGNHIEIASKKTYDYSQCGHTEYNNLIKKKKDLEDFLKALKPDMEVFDTETGERIYPPTFTTSKYLKITQK